MMNKRFYMIQKDPEFLNMDYYFDFDDAAAYDGIIVLGGRNFVSFKTKEYKSIENQFDYLVDELDRIANKSFYANYKTVSELFNDVIPKTSGKAYNTKEIHQIKEIIKNSQYDFDLAAAPLLELITDKKHVKEIIRGYCQGDYAEIICPVESYNNIDYMEACYFGTGTEYLCATIESDNILTPDDIDSYQEDYFYHYTTAWNAEALKNEVKKMFELDADVEIIIYNIDKTYTKKIYKYKLAD